MDCRQSISSIFSDCSLTSFSLPALTCIAGLQDEAEGTQASVSADLQAYRGVGTEAQIDGQFGCQY